MLLEAKRTAQRAQRKAQSAKHSSHRMCFLGGVFARSSVQKEAHHALRLASLTSRLLREHAYQGMYVTWTMFWAKIQEYPADWTRSLIITG